MTAVGRSPGADRRALSRAGYGLAAAAAGATVFALAPRTDAVRFVNVPLPVVAVLLGIAALGMLGARTGNHLLFAAAAGLGLGAAVLQMLELALGTGLLGGNGSTAAFLAAIGIGFGALWYAGRQEADGARDHGTDRP